MGMVRRILNTAIFWSAWIIIPFLMEILPSIASLFLLAVRRHKEKKRYHDPGMWPEVSIIIPVYNSEGTLKNCISSIAQSHYPVNSIRLFLVNNGSTDHSFSVYESCQKAYPKMHMQWLNAEQGKSRALNEALYNTGGKYIVNIDSDGVLDPDALRNIVRRFESRNDLNVMTGTILTDYHAIHATRSNARKLLQDCEFMEYAQTFLAGRSYASEINSLYTISGAFSAFRKSAVLSSWLYNTATVGEDTHMTFQMRYLNHERIEICEDAIFYVDPIESLNKLYTQRQRWQRGELEVASLFAGESSHLHKMFTDTNMHALVYDHTFAFPRLVWYLALILLTWLNYSGSMVLYAFLLIFVLYIVSGYLYFISVERFLKTWPEMHKFYLHHFWTVALLPVYNLMLFFFRLAGIINSIGSGARWRTKDFSDERKSLEGAFKEDTVLVRSSMHRAYSLFNHEEVKSTACFSKKQKILIALLCILIGIGSLVFMHYHWMRIDLSSASILS